MYPKLFNENEDDITGEMSEAKLVEFFDKVKEKLAKRKQQHAQIDAEEVFHVNTEDAEQVPKWAEELRAEVSALKTSLATLSSTDSNTEEQNKAFFYRKEGKSYKKQNKDPCSICKKNNHSAKNCYKRICGKCSGVGHDADKCASRLGNKKRQR